MEETLKKIETVLETQVRPSLRAHGGEIAIDHLEDGILYVKLLGQCAGDVYKRQSTALPQARPTALSACRIP